MPTFLTAFLAIQLGQNSRLLQGGGALSEIKIRTIIRTQRSFGCLASLHLELWTFAECKKTPNRYCYSKWLQSEALYPLHLLRTPSNVLQLVLGYTFLSKATQEGNGIKEAGYLQQIFPEKSDAQISIRAKSSKKNKKPFLRESRSVEPILTKKPQKQRSWGKKLPPHSTSELWGGKEGKQGNRNNFLVTESHSQTIVSKCQIYTQIRQVLSAENVLILVWELVSYSTPLYSVLL